MSIVEGSNSNIPISSEKNFGYVFSGVFLIITFYSLLYQKGFHMPAILTSCFFFLSALVYPKILSIPNKLWFKFGLFLGSIISPITMGLIFFLTVVPTGLIMRILGRDILRKNKGVTNSYWIKKEKNISTMKNQF